ncbi:MAG: cyclodeaminase/cyclohydrolase family protein [Clostridiales bacterium]|nr:cyclodeaminase/cyclohydrolase family protein [Clostridiales bacterium]
MRELSIDEFTQVLSSAAPVPGGGGASALMGVLSSALCSMVASLTTGKKKYAEYQGDIERILADTAKLNDQIASLIEKDAEVFEPLSKAYSIPKETEGRDEILEKCLQKAAMAPYEILEKAREVSLIAEELSVKGSRIAISDVGVAATACISAAKGAAMNVYINTKLMKDRDFAEDLNGKTEALVKEITERCDKTYETVKAGLMA